MFINCHLESCGVAFKSPGSAIRQAQLREGLELIRLHSSVGPAILAGDLNIRDPEATKVMSDYTSTITDAAERVEKGRKSNTWFMPAPSKYSARYDRVYSNNSNQVTPVQFKTIGGENINEGTGLDANGDLPYNTASDHRGIVVVYKFIAPEGNGATSSTNQASATIYTSAAGTTGPKEPISALHAVTTNNKRPRSNIPVHAEVITLDDSDTDDDTDIIKNAPNKRTKGNNSISEAPFNPEATFLNAINTSYYEIAPAILAVVTEEKTLTAQERRALILKAAEQRHKGV